MDRLPIRTMRSTRSMRSAGLTLLVVALSSAILVAYFGFTADDAYIFLRYAENLVDHGALVYNRGEWVMTMTSPVVALVEALLYAATGEALLAYKLICIACLAFSAWTTARFARDDARLRVAVLAVVMLSPCVLLWTVGGMETPLLMALVSGVTALALRADLERASVLVLLGILCGVAFVTRFDSVCFTAPVALQVVARAGTTRRRLVFVLSGLALPLVWIAIALHWYGDLFPTSYYVKTPSVARRILATNALYIAQYLAFVGLLPLALFLFARGRANGSSVGLARHVRSVWGPWTGIGLMLVYGLSSATTHMMFGFRYFVPYVPTAALLLALALVTTNAKVLGTKAFAAFLVLFVPFQLVHAWHVYARSLNGLSVVGELRDTSVEETVRIMPESALLAERIREHWLSLGGPPDVHPRIHTFAEGIIPYVYRDAYVLGRLVSYRHHCRPNLVASAHYVVQLSATPTEISTGNFLFQGESMMLSARYTEHPLPGVLPPRIDGKCAEAPGKSKPSPQGSD